MSENSEGTYCFLFYHVVLGYLQVSHFLSSNQELSYEALLYLCIWNRLYVSSETRDVL